MKCVKRLTADQQRLAEENLTIVERVLRFDINANPCVAGLGYEDLYQEGCVWLCNAALTFDPARGSFASYARQVVQNSSLATRIQKIAGFIFYYGGAFPHFQLSRLVRNSAIRSRCFRKLRSCTYSVFSYTKADGTEDSSSL